MADSSDGLRIGLLGPVEAWVDGEAVALGGQRPRAVLAVLALGGGRVVSADRLIDELWGDELPERARATLQVNVSRLRKGLGGEGSRLVARSGGYALELEPGQCDVDRWRRALERARRARADGDPAAARASLEDALAVWRGEPLAGVDGAAGLDAERARLEEERLAAVLEGVELDLELNRHGEVLGQLETLVAANPFVERVVELQMRALYRCGRQADALAAFHSARRRFTDELGIEPSQPLRDLHDDVLTHAEGLAAPTAAPAARGLPAPPNRTIGRDGEIAAVAGRLRGGARLVTLTGPGGVGKTRLALEAGRAVEGEFADGAVFVGLGALRRADDVPSAVVDALGGVVLGGESAETAAARFLTAKHVLLVVDNLEQVLGAAPFLGELLATCPAVAILATSREPLALAAEACQPVLPLGGDAVTLFSERARAHDPGFDPGDGAAIAEICRRVDGLPLAIELAAARCALLSPAEIAARLETALGPGARDAPARQQSLTATIDWSHDLLDADEQRCFALFAVFAGGATVAAAEAVTGADLDVLDGLVAKSLLVRRRGTRTRLRMLETIRAYAAERLDAAADAEAVHEAHHRYYLRLARRHGDDRALGGAAAREHLAALDAELENVHAALAWAIARADAEAALAIAAAISSYWLLRNRYDDAVDRIGAVLALPGTEAHPSPLAHVLRIQSRCLSRSGRVVEAAGVLDEAEAVSRRAGDALELSRTLQVRVLRHVDDETLAVADRIADEAIRCAEAAGDAWEIARAVGAKAIAAQTLGELVERVETATTLLADTGDVLEHTRVLVDASYSALCLGGDGAAAGFAERAAPLARVRDDRFSQMIIIGNLGLSALLSHDLGGAARAFREELMLCRELVVRPQAYEGLRGLAAVAVAQGDGERAARLAGAAEAQRFQQVLDPFSLRLDRTILEPARERLGADLWDAAAAAGGALSFEAAIAYALGEPPAAGAGDQSTPGNQSPKRLHNSGSVSGRMSSA